MILTTNDRIAKIILSKNCLRDNGVEILLKGLQKNQSVVHLDLSSNDITHKGGEIIFEALLNQHSLVSLDLSSKEGINRNRLTADGVRKLEKVLKANFYLEFLYLGGNSLKNEGLRYILSGLNNSNSLHALDISNNEITANGIHYFRILLIFIYSCLTSNN